MYTVVYNPLDPPSMRIAPNEIGKQFLMMTALWEAL